MVNAPKSTKPMFSLWQKNHHESMDAMIDRKKPIKVYFNLHKRCWSVMQDHKVRFHTDYIVLRDCTFEVSKRGREKVLQSKRKNVHAFVKGFFTVPGSFPQAVLMMETVTYNPYHSGSFYKKYNETYLVSSAKYVDMMSSTIDKVLAAF